MKSRNYFGLTVISATLALLYSSCRDQDFDWEDHYRENVEYQYQEIIKSIFGEISPDQSWDFSGFSADDTVAEENVTHATRAITTGDYYEVPDGLKNWFNDELPESQDERYRNKGTRGFVIPVPQYGFKVTPLYTGQSLNWKLYIQQCDANGNPIGNSPVLIWDKGTNMQIEAHDCFRIKYNGTANGYLIESNNGIKVANNGNDKWGIVTLTSTNGEKFNAIINLNTGKYLGYNGQTSKFICETDQITQVVGNKGRYAVTMNYDTQNNYYRFQINGHYIVEAYNEINNDQQNLNDEWVRNNSRWSFEEVIDPIAENRYQEAIGLGTWGLNNNNNYKNTQASIQSYEGINNLHYSNKTSWKDINKYTTTIGSFGVEKIQAKTYTIEPGTFPQGSYVTLYLEITENRIYSEAQMVDATSNGSRVVGTKMWSKEQMLALNVPNNRIPDNKKTVKINGRSYNNTVYIVGCEDANVADRKNGNSVTVNNVVNKSGYGTVYSNNTINNHNTTYVKSDWDYNDVVLMIEGYGLKPEDVTYDYEYFSKRYMVEDLGFDSQKKLNKTDIDFNDIVVDIVDNCRGYRYEKDAQGKRVTNTRTDYTNPNGKTEVTVWALGGVLDFDLYTYDADNGGQYSTTNRIEVFKKSSPGAQYLNPNYRIENIAITGLTSSTMYNTSRSYTGCDGNFNTNLFIWHKTFDYGQLKWDHTKNNIVFVVKENYVNENFTSEGVKEGSIITFPAKGDTHPQIIAFPIGTEWNEERQGIDQKKPGNISFTTR